MVAYTPIQAPLKDILLDPNNYRYTSPAPSTKVPERRFEEESVQASALNRLTDDGITELRQSIAQNGFIPVERIVVRPWQGNEGKYVVVEGNRRTAALKTLQRESLSGIEFPHNLSETFDAVPVLLASDSTDDDLLAIMGIRHVGGPKEWGGYQSASLVYELMARPELTAREVASKLGLTVNEVNRRNRAFSALRQMQNDDDWGDSVTQEMYPLFHEAVGQPIVREWLGWDSTESLFSEDRNRELFYSWIAGQDGEPKISKFSQVRDLRVIIENSDALNALKDPESEFSDALAVVRSDIRSRRWSANATAALNSLRELTAEQIQELKEDDRQLLEALRKKAQWVIRVSQVEASDDED